MESILIGVLEIVKLTAGLELEDGELEGDGEVEDAELEGVGEGDGVVTGDVTIKLIVLSESVAEPDVVKRLSFKIYVPSPLK